jgi:hypothetical protein
MTCYAERGISLNNNINNKKDDSNTTEKIYNQQFNPGGSMPPPRRRPGTEDERRNEPPQMPPPPGMGQMPKSAPPNFIPEAPGMERRQMGGPGPSGYGVPFRGEMRQTEPRDIRRCLNQFTFIWLVNGNSFWFYPTFVSRDFVQGFRWRRDRWEFDRINLRRIFFSRCF